MWQKLQDTFQKKTWANKLRLKRKLYNMKLKAGDSLQLHLKSFTELFEELAVIGDAIEEEDRVINLLVLLSDSYSTLVTALEALNKVPSWEAVTERLLHEEEKSSKPSDEVRSRPSENSSLVVKQKVRKPPKCYKCGKTGHIKKNCVRIEKSVNEGRDNRPNKGQVNIAAKVTSSDEEFTLFASALSTVGLCGSSDSWVIDSGATRHMCNNRKHFSKSIDLSAPLNVEVGDGRTLSAVGKVSVSLKLKLPNNKIKLVFWKMFCLY